MFKLRFPPLFRLGTFTLIRQILRLMQVFFWLGSVVIELNHLDELNSPENLTKFRLNLC